MSETCTKCGGGVAPATSPCPNKMQDARAFTDYRPRCAVQSELMQTIANAKMMQSSYDLRMYLQKNADAYMDLERRRAIERVAPCAPCKRSPLEPGTMLPERYVVRCNGVSCSREEVNPAGLGDGRNY